MNSHFFIGTSADHIGPISLGFVHDPHYLQPMSSGDNSSKRDKLSYEDIELLINIERKTGISAISWFSSKIWNNIKENYKSKPNLIPVYRYILKQNMANFMFILWTIQQKCKQKGNMFLINNLLKNNFECFNYDYSFNANGEIIKKTLRHKTNSSKNEFDRYIRIAFDSVEEYNNKENRNLKNNLDNDDLECLNQICTLINKNYNENKIKNKLIVLIDTIQNKLIEKNIL